MAVAADTDALMREVASRLSTLEAEVGALSEKIEVLQKMHMGLPTILMQLGEYLETMDGRIEQMQAMFGAKQ